MRGKFSTDRDGEKEIPFSPSRSVSLVNAMIHCPSEVSVVAAVRTAEVRYAVGNTGLPTDAISLTQESDDGKESGKKSAAMRVSANDGGASGRSGASRGVASPAAQSRWTNFLMCSGYAVQIVGGKHFTTPDGAFVEMKSRTQYEIFVKNTHSEGKRYGIN